MIVVKVDDPLLEDQDPEVTPNLYQGGFKRSQITIIFILSINIFLL